MTKRRINASYDGHDKTAPARRVNGALSVEDAVVRRHTSAQGQVRMPSVSIPDMPTAGDIDSSQGVVRRTHAATSQTSAASRHRRITAESVPEPPVVQANDNRRQAASDNHVSVPQRHARRIDANGTNASRADASSAFEAIDSGTKSEDAIDWDMFDSIADTRESVPETLGDASPFRQEAMTPTATDVPRRRVQSVPHANRTHATRHARVQQSHTVKAQSQGDAAVSIRRTDALADEASLTQSGVSRPSGLRVRVDDDDSQYEDEAYKRDGFFGWYIDHQWVAYVAAAIIAVIGMMFDRYVSVIMAILLLGFGYLADQQDMYADATPTYVAAIIAFVVPYLY